MNLLSLDNFDQSSTKEPIITSPRSIEACRRQGIHPSELIIKNLEEIKIIYKEKDVDKVTLEQRAKHYEERRREKIRILLDERIQLMEEEKQGLWHFSENSVQKSVKEPPGSRYGQKINGGSGSSTKNAVQSTMIEKEKKQLEKLKAKQQKEIEQMLDYEMKMAEIRKKNEEKLGSQKEREREREKELVKKRKEQEEYKRLQEEEKKKKVEEDLENQKKKTLELYEKEQDKQRLEKQKEAERQIESRKKEEEQKLKQEEFRKQTEEKLLKQQQLVDEKKREMEEKDRYRKELLQQQQLQKIEEAKKLREQHEEMLKTAKLKNEEDLQRKRELFTQKQLLNEQKKLLFEQENEKRKEESRRIAEEKSKHLKEVMQTNIQLEDRKRQEYLLNQQKAAERKRELDQIAQEEAAKKKELERLEQERRKTVKENNDKMINEKKEFYVSKMKETDEKVLRSQLRKTIEMKEKHNIEILKIVDKRENVDRIMKMQEYQRDKIMDKILRDNEKAEQIRYERNNILEMRRKLRQDIEKSKQEIFEKFNKVKTGKMDPNSLMEEYGQNQNKSNYNTQQIEPKKMRTTKSQDSLRTKPIKTNQQTKNESKLTSKINHINEKEIKDKVENLRMQQNHEMLLILEEEQANESKREEMISKIFDAKERKRLDKIFGMERAKAQSRIQELSELHERNLEKLINQIN